MNNTGYRTFVEYYNIYHSNPIKDLVESTYVENLGSLMKDSISFSDDKSVSDGQRHSPATTAALIRDFIINKRKICHWKQITPNLYYPYTHQQLLWKFFNNTIKTFSRYS